MRTTTGRFDTWVVMCVLLALVACRDGRGVESNAAQAIDESTVEDHAADVTDIVKAAFSHERLGIQGDRPLVMRDVDRYRGRVDSVRSWSQQEPRITEELIAAFEAANTPDQTHTDVEAADWGAVLITDEELEFYWVTAGKGWDALYEDYPGCGGHTVLSRPAFDAERRKAVIYVGTQIGPMSGWGVLHLVEKVEGVWTSIAFTQVWQS